MSQDIIRALEGLPERDLTVSLLEALDFAVPGQWENVRSAAGMLERALGEPVHPEIARRVSARAQALFASPGHRFETALRLLTMVDTLDQVASAATVASKVGGLFGGALDFLEEFTPKPATTQSIDAGVKLVVELVAFGMIRGLPEDASFEQIADFVLALQHYAKSDVMRIGAWVVVDGLLPLGPNFMGEITETIRGAAESTLQDNSIFESVAAHIPGGDVGAKRDFILTSLEATSGWVNQFVKERGLTRELIVAKISEIVTVSESALDVVAAGLDASTNYFSHTGTQTVAREVLVRAHEELKQEVWREWVASIT